MCLENTGWVVNSVDPDRMLQSVASDLGLHLLLTACLSTEIFRVKHIKYYFYLPLIIVFVKVMISPSKMLKKKKRSQKTNIISTSVRFSQ